MLNINMVRLFYATGLLGELGLANYVVDGVYNRYFPPNLSGCFCEQICPEKEERGHFWMLSDGFCLLLEKIVLTVIGVYWYHLNH